MHRRTLMTHEESEREGCEEGRRAGGREKDRVGSKEEGVVAAAAMVAVAVAVARWMCERTDDRTDGVHKARRAKLDREQKEREDARGWVRVRARTSMR